jgi:hypothetical protein
MLTDAAASQTPITVSELLTRSEKLALGDSSGSPEPTLGSRDREQRRPCWSA